MDALEELHVAISSGPVDYRKDGSLSVRDVQTLDLTAKLVFLHGCQSLQGGVGQTVGLVGLSSAFLAAGAENVIATHWAIPVESVLNDALVDFYRRFTKLSVEDNLRATRFSLRNAKGMAARPYTWGVFSVFH